MKINVSWSIGIVLLGILGLGVCYENGRLMGYVKGTTGPRSVKAQTCLNVNEIAKLNFADALGCPRGEKTEILQETTLPITPVTISSVTKDGSKAYNAEATVKRPLRAGIDVEAGVAIEIWNNRPHEKSPTLGLNRQQPPPFTWKPLVPESANTQNGKLIERLKEQIANLNDKTYNQPLAFSK